MNKKVVKYLKIAVVVVVVGLLLWVFVINPLLTFKGYEKKTIEAAKRYYEINARELPTGTRVKTLSIQELFDQKYLKEDFYIPFSKKPCSITESWVKVRKEDNEYKYYTYLKCGIISSTVDHRGPDISLSGEDKMTLEVGEKYKEPGVSSVVDNTDGKMDVKDVEIDSSEVNTNTPGSYEVTYTAYDSLNNKSEVVRTVEVVATLKNTVKKATNKTGVYTGMNPNNYIYFSGMVFRIVGLNGDNVKIVAEQDVSNVNYDAIDEWLEYYYDHISATSKKYIVDSKYCDMKATDDNISTIKKCSSYTKKVPVSILSADDYNLATDENNDNYLFPDSISWVRNDKNDTNAYAARLFFYGWPMSFMSFSKNYNFGVRPVLTIKGDASVVSGNGTKDNPYSIDDFKYAEVGDKLNTRQSGEYISYSGLLWRIIDSESDGTTKVISSQSLFDDYEPIVTRYDTEDKAKIYNPKQRGNVGYTINNVTPNYVKTDYFVNKEFEVPIYKRNIKYNEEKSTKKYKARFLAPNMYEMFTAADFNVGNRGSYWFINSSQKENTKAVVAEIGTVMYGNIYDYDDYGIRPVGFFDKHCVIVRGKGTIDDPYIIEK